MTIIVRQFQLSFSVKHGAFKGTRSNQSIPHLTEGNFFYLVLPSPRVHVVVVKVNITIGSLEELKKIITRSEQSIKIGTISAKKKPRQLPQCPKRSWRFGSSVVRTITPANANPS
jgi:hypothetical protein